MFAMNIRVFFQFRFFVTLLSLWMEKRILGGKRRVITNLFKLVQDPRENLRRKKTNFCHFLAILAKFLLCAAPPDLPFLSCPLCTASGRVGCVHACVQCWVRLWAPRVIFQACWAFPCAQHR